MAKLYWNQAALGKVVEPFESIGAVPSPFSVLTHVIVCATAEKSNTRTILISQSIAQAVGIVSVRVAAELFVIVFTLYARFIVAALDVAVIELTASVPVERS